MQKYQVDLNSKTAKSVINIVFWEQVIIGAIILVLGVLKLTGVIPTDPTRLLIYNIITLVGGAWFIFDLFWCIFSSKRRMKTSLFDKILTGPVSSYLIFFDIFCFVVGRENANPDFVKFSIGSVLLYASILLFIQAFYHKKHPAPMTIAAIIETENELKKAEQEEAKEQENKEEK